MVRHFYQTAPTKRKFALGIDEEPALKRRGKKPEEEEKDRETVEMIPNNLTVAKAAVKNDSSDETVVDYLQRVTNCFDL